MLVSTLPPPPINLVSNQIPFELQSLLCRLPASDQVEYFNLMNFFNYTDDRNKRNLGMSTFIKHLNTIHDYICKGDANDAFRGLVCGIEFSQNSFLINTSRLKKLMCRSKSCMNGCFQKLGYVVCRPSQDISSIFAQILPRLNPHWFSTRQWCVRKASEMSSAHFTPNINVDIFPHETVSPLPSITTLEHIPLPITSNPIFDITNLLNKKDNRIGSAPITLPSLAPLF